METKMFYDAPRSISIRLLTFAKTHAPSVASRAETILIIILCQSISFLILRFVFVVGVGRKFGQCDQVVV